MRIGVDREACIGAGQCVLSTPEFFDQSTEDGRVVLREAHPDRRDEDRLRTAIDLCPARALSLVDE